MEIHNDILSGKVNIEKVDVAPTPLEAEQKKVEKVSLFSSLCKQMLKYLSPDDRAEMCRLFLTPEFITIFKDRELVDCVNAFFNNNLNLSETSRVAFVHRNTLIYRIEKIARLTGLNIRNFEDAMSFKILSILYENMANRNYRK